MRLGKDAHQIRLDLLHNEFLIKIHNAINSNRTVLVESNELINSVFLNGFNGIKWF